MDKPQLAPDFKEFLRSLNARGVEYLLVGGYAVGYHGYPRATNDLDVWIAASRTNAANVAAALQDFGFSASDVNPEIFRQQDRIFRIGIPPMRIELLTGVSGLAFARAYQNRLEVDFDGVEVSLISLEDLKANKRASGRLKDLADLEELA